jgi:hypothetical protein
LKRLSLLRRQLRDGEASGVVVELDKATIDEARQTLPAREHVADGVGKLAPLTDQTELCVQPLILKSCNFPDGSGMIPRQ